MANVQTLPSTSSLASAYTKIFSTSATPTYPGNAYADYGFIAVLGLAQRLKIDLLPITWQALLGLIGQSRARINQALLSIQTSFAFKRFDHHNQSDPFREVVQEMAILGHPLVQGHPHIVNLIGICWDISENNENNLKHDQDILTGIQIWPVLVFEKSHLGDLYSFARSGNGKGLSLESKLKICADIGIAIRDMHLNNIIHGDVKPQNVLIFRDRLGVYTAKVADFGFSTHFHGEKDLINMPRSVPWNAPEHHDRAFYPQAAKAIDVYSFGMLALWLLFGVESETLPYPSQAANVAETFSFEARDWSEKGDVLLSWKSDRLLDWATQLIARDRRLKTEVKDRVTRFFLSSLSVDPQKRITDWGCILSFLDPARETSCTASFNKITIVEEEDFQIASSILTLYPADFRLRSFIATQLKEIALASTTPIFKHTSKAKAAEQAAFCYRTGFGVPKDEGMVKELSISQSQNSALEKQIQLIKDGELHLFNNEGRFYQFFQQGVVQVIDFHYYNEKGLASSVETVLKREIQDTKDVYGNGSWLNIALRAKLASIYWNQGRWKEAEELLVQVMETFKRILGDEHLDTLTSIANLASIYRNQGRWKEAEEIEVQVIETRKKVLGDEHPETLTGMDNLASTYRNQGRWKEAEELFVQVMETRKRVLSGEHPETLISMANLASTYRNQGCWKEAEELFVKVIETLKRVLGDEHPDTLTCMDSLASTYRNQGQWKEAEEIEVQVIGTRKKVLGDEHPNTLTSMANLASTYRNQGRWKEAEQLQAKELEICSSVLGDEHPDTLTSMDNLASTYWNQGRWKEAEELFVQVIRARKKVLGYEHPDTLTSMGNLASTYWNQGWCKEAEELEVQVMEMRKRVLGDEHPETLTSMANLASTYWNQGRWKEAEELLVHTIETRKKVLGDEHPDTLISIANLASTYRNQGRWKEAEELFVQVIEARKRALGYEHPNTLTSIANLASTYRSQGRWKEATELEVQVMEARKKVLGDEHPSTLNSIGNLALTFRNQGRWKEAEELFVQAMETRKRVLGEEHPDTLTSINNLAFTLRAQGSLGRAISLIENCYKLQTVVLGPRHPDTMSSLEALTTWRLEAIELIEQNNS